MFDLNSKLSYKSVKDWLDELRKHCPGIPVVLVGNKSDVLGKRFKIDQKHGLPYFNISVKNCYNFPKPILALARKLVDLAW